VTAPTDEMDLPDDDYFELEDDAPNAPEDL
jgi:hypothetical protein